MIHGFILAAFTTVCTPSDITQAEASHLAGLVAFFKSGEMQLTISYLNRTEVGDSWGFQARSPGNQSPNPDVGTYRVDRRTANVVDVDTGKSASFPQLRAAQNKVLQAHCLNAKH